MRVEVDDVADAGAWATLCEHGCGCVQACVRMYFEGEVEVRCMQCVGVLEPPFDFVEGTLVGVFPFELAPVQAE